MYRPTGLDRVERRICELKASIAPILREIEMLEEAARVLRALDQEEAGRRKAKRRKAPVCEEATQDPAGA